MNVLFSQNILTDSKGQSSLSLNPVYKGTSKEDLGTIDTVSFNLGMITFATATKKIELNYYKYFTPIKFTNFFVGASASGELNNSISTLLSNGTLATGVNATIKIGFRLFKSHENWYNLFKPGMPKDVIQNILDKQVKPASDLWLVMNATFDASKFNLLNTDSTFVNQIEKISFTGYDINIGLNYWNARIIENTFLFGTTFGIKRTNNFDDLIESTKEDVRTIKDSTSNTVSTITSKQTVFTGNYKENIVFPLNVDLYFVPHHLQNLGFLVYSRTNFAKSAMPLTKLGFGVFFLKNQNAFNPLAGLTFDYADAFNVDNTNDTKSNLNKISISLTIRVNVVNSAKK